MLFPAVGRPPEFLRESCEPPFGVGDRDHGFRFGSRGSLSGCHCAGFQFATFREIETYRALRLSGCCSLAIFAGLWGYTPAPPVRASTAATVTSPFGYKFNTIGMLPEAGNMNDSWSPYWWLSSGGRFFLDGGVGSTVKGNLASNDYWRRYYEKTSPVDTDSGYHPQNLFRLVTRSKWKNFRQQVYFRIRNDNLSTSANRNASNGLYLMDRYLDQDQDNLYYTGIRVDGAAVIKKKIRGTYYTVAYAPLFPGSAYDRDSNPSLLPKDIWIGLRSEVTNHSDGTVRIVLYVDPGPGGWSLVFDVLDNGLAYGGSALTASGYGGFRTDFMDVEFENYWAVTLN